MLNALQEMYDATVNSVKDVSDADAAIGICMGDLVNRNAVLLELHTQSTTQQMPKIDFANAKYGEGILSCAKHGNKVLHEWANEISRIQRLHEHNTRASRTFCVDYYVWLQATMYKDAFEKFRQVVCQDNRLLRQSTLHTSKETEVNPGRNTEVEFIQKYVSHLHTFDVAVFHKRFNKIGNHVTSVLADLDSTDNEAGTKKWDDIISSLHRWFFIFIVYSMWLGKVRDMHDKNTDMQNFMFMKLMTDRIHNLIGLYKKKDMTKYSIMTSIWDLNKSFADNIITSGAIIRNVSPERTDLVKQVRTIFFEVEVIAQAVNCRAMLVRAGYSMPVLDDILGFRAVHVITNKTENMYMDLMDAITLEFEKITSSNKMKVLYNVVAEDSLRDLLREGEKVKNVLKEFERKCKDMEKEMLSKTAINHGEDERTEAMQITKAAQDKVQHLIDMHNSIMDKSNG